jgi:hypothetical protein
LRFCVGSQSEIQRSLQYDSFKFPGQVNLSPFSAILLVQLGVEKRNFSATLEKRRKQREGILTLAKTCSSE